MVLRSCESRFEKTDRKLLDPADVAEKARTKYILDEGASPRIVAALSFSG